MSESGAQQPGSPALVASMWRYRYILVLVAVICGVAGYLLSAAQPTTYQATTTIVLTDPSEGGLSGTATRIDPDRYLQQQANRAAAADVFTRAAEQLGGGASGAELSQSTAVDADLDIGAITVTASGEEPERVAEVANAVATAYEQLRRESRQQEIEAANEVLQEQVAQLREQSNNLDERLGNNPDDTVTASRMETVQAELFALQTRMSELAADAAVFGAGIEMTEAATVPDEPASPNPVRDALLLAILGVAVGSAVAYRRAGSFQRVETRVDAGSVLDVQLLGEVPRFARSGRPGGASGGLLGPEAAEAFEFLLSSIEFSLAETNGTSFLVTSAAPGDGKTSTALNLAIASARQRRNVVLVDTDVRAHGLTTMLNAESKHGLVELAEGASLDDCTRRYQVSEGVRLAVVPSGRAPDEPTGLLRAPEFKEAMSRIKDASDLAIFDSAPILAVADATVVATQVDAIVLVVDSRTPVEELQRVRERLSFVSTPVIGYIYNRAPSNRFTKYGYGYGTTKQSTFRRLLGPTGGGANGDGAERHAARPESTGSAFGGRGDREVSRTGSNGYGR